MGQKDTIISLLQQNGIMTQGALAEAMYGDKYMSFGFKYVDKVEITYVDIGVPRKFLLYEFVL